MAKKEIKSPCSLCGNKQGVGTALSPHEIIKILHGKVVVNGTNLCPHSSPHIKPGEYYNIQDGYAN